MLYVSVKKIDATVPQPKADAQLVFVGVMSFVERYSPAVMDSEAWC